MCTNSPIVNVAPLQKYTLVAASRMHNKYTPAVAPPAFTFSVTLVEFTNTDHTLVTTDNTTLQFLEITNAPPSLDTLSNPAPLTPTICTPLVADITLGTTDVTDSRSNVPAEKYGDTLLHRTHSSYTPATAPLPLTLNEIALPLAHELVTHEFPTTVGAVAFGNEHDTAITNAPLSPLTSGIAAPLSATL